MWRQRFYYDFDLEVFKLSYNPTQTMSRRRVENDEFDLFPVGLILEFLDKGLGSLMAFEKASNKLNSQWLYEHKFQIIGLRCHDLEVVPGVHLKVFVC